MSLLLRRLGAGTDALLANDVESTSEVSTPAIGQVHVLLANDVQSTSEVGSPAIHQVHALLANDVQSASEVTTPAIGQVHALLANDVQSASEVTAPALGQVHVLTAVSVEALSEVSSPSLVEFAADTPERDPGSAPKKRKPRFVAPEEVAEVLPPWMQPRPKPVREIPKAGPLAAVASASKSQEDEGIEDDNFWMLWAA